MVSMGDGEGVTGHGFVAIRRASPSNLKAQGCEPALGGFQHEQQRKRPKQTLKGRAFVAVSELSCHARHALYVMITL